MAHQHEHEQPVMPPVTPRPAAVVVLLRDEADGNMAVFMVRRHAGSAFMPDVFVFPGGSVGPDDVAIEHASDLCTPAGVGVTGLGHGYRAAAIRECFEEAGVLLARRDGAPLAVGADADDVERFLAYRHALQARSLTLADLARREGLTLATDDLLHWAHWITPEESPKRFDTHFFLALMPPRQEAAHDQLETTAGVWVTPQDALRQDANGAMPISNPTLHQVRDLVGLNSAAEAWRRFVGRVPRTNLPRLAYRDGQVIMLMPDD